MEVKSKWEFLRPAINRHLDQNPGITITEVANLILEEFDLAQNTEQMRKIVSRLVNNQPDAVEAQVVNTVDVYSYVPPVVQETTQGTPVLRIKHRKPGRYLVLGCWHVPFHNQKFHDNIRALMQREAFDGLVLLGDFLDCNTLSGHSINKFPVEPGLTILKEYTAGKVILKDLIQFLPKHAEKFYLYGNHEDRYFRYISDMQNAKTPPPSPTEGLDLYGLGFQVIEDYRAGYMTLGDHLDLLHGVYYNVHCAKTHIDRFRGSVMFAHTHRIQQYIEGHTGGFNIGWGGDVNHAAFNYADRGTKASWQNGAAVVYIDDQMDYHVQQIIANDGNFIYGNTFYKN